MNRTDTIALISMPWAQPVEPNLPLGQLHGLIQQKCPSTRCYSFSFHLKFLQHLEETFAARSLALYQQFVSQDGLGDLIFAGPAHLEPGSEAHLVSQQIESFIAACLTELSEAEATTFIFVPIYLEIYPSLVLAQALRQAMPQAKICLWTQELAHISAQALTGLDGIFDQAVSHDDVFVVWQKLFGKEEWEKQPTRKISLVKPDFSEYFERLRVKKTYSLVYHQLWLPFEAAKGCWWAEKSKCSFCALTRENSLYRQANPGEAALQMKALATSYRVRKFQLLDWIQPKGWGALWKQPLFSSHDFLLYVQSRADFSLKEAKQLKQNNVYMQIGIESLSTWILRKVKKGTDLLTNIQALRLAKSFDIPVYYNLIYDFPFDRACDYFAMAKQIPYLSHLPPPNLQKFRLRRMSPIFNHPKDYGIADVRLKSSDVKLFAQYGEQVSKALASEFDFKRSEEDADLAFAHEQFINATKAWQAGQATFKAKIGPGFVEVVDTRLGTKRVRTIAGDEARVFLTVLQSPQPINCQNQEYLARWHDQKLVIIDEGKVLGLPLLSEQGWQYGQA